jgi:DUF4097 and DUF4098 domain-containing protein YvlB
MKGTAIVTALVTILGLLAVSGCDLDQAYKFSESTIETKSMPLTGVETLETRLGAADITVVTKDVTQAEFIIKKTYRASEKDYGEKLMRELVVTLEQRGSRLVLEREEKTNLNPDKFFNGFASLDITITLPARIALDILTGSGDLEIDDRTGPIEVKSGSGDIRVSNAGGGLDVKMGSGDVRVHSASGPVRVTAGSGDFFATDVRGDVVVATGSGEISLETLTGDGRFSTGSGDITVAASTGTVNATTGSGDIEFRGHKGSAEVLTSSGSIFYGASASDGTVRLKASSGNIGVTLYGLDSVELEVATISGSISSKVPIVVKHASRKRLVGLVGDGRLKLNIETASGDVSVVPGSI